MRKLWFAAGVIALAFGCGKKGGDSKATWLDKAWKPVSGELKHAAFTAEVPDGLPENTKNLLGKDWWVGIKTTGPRLHLDSDSAHYADVAAWKKSVRPDANPTGVTEIAAEQLPDGRLRYASALVGGAHVEVNVWIPMDESRGVSCSADWYFGDDHGDQTPDPKVVAWLDRFCASVHVTAK